MPKVALVTGANQGLGFALVKGLCQCLGPDSTVYLAARDHARGRSAVNQLQALGLQPLLVSLDVSDDASVERLARHLESSHRSVDIVISNAAARIDKHLPQSDQVEHFINTNNLGTHRMLRHFVPLLSDGARFLVVASGFGSLRNLDPDLHPLFDIEHCSLHDIEQTMSQYVQLVQRGQAAQQKWPEWINIPSKVAQVASMKIAAREHSLAARRRGILINAVCPGLVDTEASRPWFDDMSQAQSPDDAARDVLWLACLPQNVDHPYGELVQHQKLIPWT